MKKKQLSNEDVYNNILDVIIELEHKLKEEHSKRPSLNSLLAIHAHEASIDILRELSNHYAE